MFFFTGIGYHLTPEKMDSGSDAEYPAQVLLCQGPSSGNVGDSYHLCSIVKRDPGSAFVLVNQYLPLRFLEMVQELVDVTVLYWSIQVWCGCAWTVDSGPENGTCCHKGLRCLFSSQCCESADFQTCPLAFQ